MKVLLVGGGGREHAIATRLVKSRHVDSLICAPGNAGIASIAQCFPVDAKDIDGQCALAVEQKVDFVVVAPDDPLALGLVDRLADLGIPAFGPTAAAAELESSKVFSKNLMQRYGIPTARFATFDDLDAATRYIEENGAPIVVKADGLALGKGVTVAQTVDEAVAAVRDCLANASFGDSGRRVVVEEYMQGREVTVLAFCDGQTVSVMPSARDHKRARDGDEGPNTGGMGVISPAPGYTQEIASVCNDTIFLPTIHAITAEGREFRGVIYFGLMLTADGPKVIEYNARFGDPEAQAILPMLRTDIMDIFLAVANGKLSSLDVEWENSASCCVVLASGGYPAAYETGFVIDGTERSSGAVFHAGTRLQDGRLVTAGGRVLAVTALAETVEGAIAAAYDGIKPIEFQGKYYRRDIGANRGDSL